MLFLIYFGVVWLQWNSQPLILMDIAQRQFHLFGTTFHPQDFVLLTWLLIICAFGLFFITVLAGRIWCGYTCPQSVFTWVFLRVEHWVEGDRNRRMQSDKRRLSLKIVLKKLTKHALWLLIALLTAITFVGYFIPIRALILDLLALDISGWALFWIIFFTLATYGNAGWLREKVCTFMCPYARFQSVMFDSNTLIVAYDDKRGEPRGRHKKERIASNSDQQLGDCIDCTMCVQVCPTGIDIRDGLQYQCIGCAACVDACNAVMDKLGLERNLVSYTTENKQKGLSTHWFRPRLIGYFLVLFVAIGSFFWMLGHRDTFEFNVLRDRQTLFRVLPSGDIENVYLLKIFNKHSDDISISMNISGLSGLQYQQLPANFSVPAGESIDLPVRVKLAAELASTKSRHTIYFTVQSSTDQKVCYQ